MARVPEIYRDEAGEYRFRVLGANGEKVAGGEGHPTPSGAERSLAALRRILRDTNGEIPKRVDC